MITFYFSPGSSSLATHIALNLEVALNVVAQGDELIVGEILHTDVAIDAGVGESLERAGATNAIDVGECDLHALLARKVDSDKTCHLVLVSCDYAEVWSSTVPGVGAGATRAVAPAGPRPPCRG